MTDYDIAMKSGSLPENNGFLVVYHVLHEGVRSMSYTSFLFSISIVHRCLMRIGMQRTEKSAVERASCWKHDQAQSVRKLEGFGGTKLN
jgi:hypothetical protein